MSFGRTRGRSRGLKGLKVFIGEAGGEVRGEGGHGQELDPIIHVWWPEALHGGYTLLSGDYKESFLHPNS